MVTFATIRNSSWQSVFNFLQTGTYAISTDNIYSAKNDELISSVGYPIVILEKPTVNITRKTLNMDGVKEASVHFAIRVYHTSGKTAEVLADEISSKFISGWRSLSSNGLKSMDMPTTDTDIYREKDKKIHVQVISLNFIYRGKS